MAGAHAPGTAAKAQVTRAETRNPILSVFLAHRGHRTSAVARHRRFFKPGRVARKNLFLLLFHFFLLLLFYRDQTDKSAKRDRPMKVEPVQQLSDYMVSDRANVFFSETSFSTRYLRLFESPVDNCAAVVFFSNLP